MREIEIDDEVYAYLQSQAIPFEELSPNATLRRLLITNKKSSISGKTNLQKYPQNKRTKQRKTNLLLLIKSGLLKEGQKLYLRDYNNNIIENYEAEISGKSLLRNGATFSMSELAKIGLKEKGFTSDSVQGPARWYNSDSISVLKLWINYLKKGE